MKAELAGCNGKKAKDCGTPSLIHIQEPAGTTARRVVLPGGREGKLLGSLRR
jgi:hypothetical protein